MASAVSVESLSAMLSYLIVVGSVGLKLPQIGKILVNRSAKGISLAMLVLELISYTIAASYSYGFAYPLLSYAENLSMIAQNLVLIALVATLNRQLGPVMVVLPVAYAAWVGCVLTGTMPLPLTTFLMNAVQIPVAAFSRVPQILANYRAKSTGQLALITFVLSGGGCAARVLTTWVGSRDVSILAGFLLNGFLNAVIVLQFLLYWKNTGEKPSQGKRKKSR
eukprot:RCo051073